MSDNLETPSAIKKVDVTDAVHETGNTENFNPLLAENVIQRSYTGPNISQNDIPEDIPEPTFQPPPFEELNPEEEIQGEAKSFNPEYSELDDKSKKQGAEMMADAILDGYTTATEMLGKVANISESKLEAEFAEGTIDPHLQLPVDEHTTLSVKEFVTSYNESASEAFSVDANFKETVRPPLVRVLMKRGAAMTDEQFLMYHFGKDILFKGVAAFQLRTQNKQILNMLRESTDKNNPKPVAQSPISNYSPEPELTQEPLKTETKQKEVFDYEEKVFSTENNDTSGFKEPYTPPPGTPKFGDPALLAHMEAASKATKNPEVKPKVTRKPNASSTKSSPKK